MTKGMTWAQEQRVLWIGEMLEIYGYVNRSHVCKKFRVSIPQAAHDFALFKKTFPGKTEYNSKTKTYEARP